MEWRKLIWKRGELSSKKSGVRNTPASLSDLILAVPNSWLPKFTLHPCSLHHYSICPQIPPSHLQRWSGGSGSRGNASCKASRGSSEESGGVGSTDWGSASSPRSWGTSPQAHLSTHPSPPLRCQGNGEGRPANRAQKMGLSWGAQHWWQAGLGPRTSEPCSCSHKFPPPSLPGSRTAGQGQVEQRTQRCERQTGVSWSFLKPCHSVACSTHSLPTGHQAGCCRAGAGIG